MALMVSRQEQVRDGTGDNERQDGEAKGGKKKRKKLKVAASRELSEHVGRELDKHGGSKLMVRQGGSTWWFFLVQTNPFLLRRAK